MDPTGIRELILEASLDNPEMLALARLTSPAVLVEPVLLRRLRLDLLPEVGPGVEADLWWSELTGSAGTTGFTLHPAVAAVLRTALAEEHLQLGGAPDTPLSRVGAILEDLHARRRPLAWLEEQLWLMHCAGEPVATLEEALRPAAAALLDPDTAPEVARWALAALPRMPEEVARSTTGVTLGLAAAAHFDRPGVVAPALREGAPIVDAAWALPGGRLKERTKVGLRAGPDWISFHPPDAPGTVALELPRTRPLIALVAWEESGESLERTVSAEPGAWTRLGPGPTVDEGARLRRLTVRSLDGDEYVLRLEPDGRRALEPGDVAGALFAVGRPGNWLATGWRLAPGRIATAASPFTSSETAPPLWSESRRPIEYDPESLESRRPMEYDVESLDEKVDLAVLRVHEERADASVPWRPGLPEEPLPGRGPFVAHVLHDEVAVPLALELESPGDLHPGEPSWRFLVRGTDPQLSGIVGAPVLFGERVVGQVTSTFVKGGTVLQVTPWPRLASAMKHPPDAGPSQGTADWAVVVGIDRYRDLPPLTHAGADAHAFLDWLISPNGGAVPEDHAFVLTPSTSAEGGPTVSDVDDAFLELLNRVRKSEADSGTGAPRRLYLYFAGHGFRVGLEEVAILTAEAGSDSTGFHVPVTAYARRIADTGLFQEIVLVADCAVSPFFARTPTTPLRAFPFDLPLLPARTNQLYLAGPGRDSHGAGGGSEMQTHESFTRAVLAGLSGEAADLEGRVTASGLTRFLEAVLGDPVSQGQQRHLQEKSPPASLWSRLEGSNWTLVHGLEPPEAPVEIGFDPIFTVSPRTATVRDARGHVVARAESGSEPWALRLTAGPYAVELAGFVRHHFHVDLPRVSPYRFEVRWQPRDTPVLVVGTGDHQLSEPEKWMSEALGAALAEAGLRLLTGGWPGVDHVVAREFVNRLAAQRVEPEPRLTHYLAEGHEPDFKTGTVVRVEGSGGELERPVEDASALVLIGGRGWTRRVSTRAQQAGVPIFSIAGTGGDARAVYASMQSRLHHDDPQVSRLDRKIETPDDAGRLAETIVSRIVQIAGDEATA